MDERAYQAAKAWLAEVSWYMNRGVVMSPKVYQQYVDLIERTRQQIAAYEATQSPAASQRGGG